MYHHTVQALYMVHVYQALLCMRCIYTTIMSNLYAYHTIYIHHFNSGVCLSWRLCVYLCLCACVLACVWLSDVLM